MRKLRREDEAILVFDAIEEMSKFTFIWLWNRELQKASFAELNVSKTWEGR